jgi:cytochrome c oxidase cbb3-type subunit 3
MAPEGIALGAKVFQVRCIECHGEKGVGGSAPSLLQSERVKRATHEELVKLIGDGALSKGMPPWRRRIKDDELKAVSAYVFSLGKLKQ